jgi:hypothetical protein
LQLCDDNAIAPGVISKEVDNNGLESPILLNGFLDLLACPCPTRNRDSREMTCALRFLDEDASRRCQCKHQPITVALRIGHGDQKAPLRLRWRAV